MFICINSGINFIEDAINRKAALIICEKQFDVDYILLKNDTSLLSLYHLWCYNASIMI